MEGSIGLLSAGLGMGYNYIPSGFRRNKRWGAKGNKGQAEAKKARNRRNNRLARKNRRLNLRRGKIAGK